jgi:Flp pilus assembly protein TadG
MRAGRKRRNQRGQALIMVTLALIAMLGIIGLAVDFGWAFFLEKSAQAAADAGALAAVKAALEDASSTADWACTGSVVQCYATPTPCPTSGALPRNLQGACIYAAQNGFTRTNARQNITVQASDSTTPPTVSGCTPTVSHPPTAPCVDVMYWVTVRVAETVPQLFSAVLGNGTGLVSARATAAIAQSEIIGSLILLNRAVDYNPEIAAGTNLNLGGSPRVIVPGGIVLASSTDHAGNISGTGDVEAPFTYIQDPGDVQISGGGTWTAPPTPKPDSAMFLDPMRDKGQPPINPSQNTLPYIAVPGDATDAPLTDTICPGGVCPPGNYYATRTVSIGGVDTLVASGARIRIPNGTTFNFSGGTFGDYVFFGGLYIDRATVDFGPGRYVLAGVKNTDTAVFETTNNAYVTGGTSETSDAGRVFILTNSSYDGQLAATAAGIPLPIKEWPSLGESNLDFGPAIFKSGNNDASRLSIYGLNKTSSFLPPELEDFGPIVIWQDQQNSYVEYTADGNIDTTSCGSGHTIDNPCPSDDITPPSEQPRLELHANQRSVFGGIVYQPRGAWTQIQAAPGYAGPLRIITGAMDVQGSGTLTLTSPSVPLTTWTASLVE